MRPDIRNAVIAVAIVSGISVVIYYALQPSDAELLIRARRTMAAGKQFARAEEIALVVARRSSKPEAWLIAGAAAFGARNWESALHHYEQVTAGTAEQKADAAYYRGECCVELRRYERAESEFQSALGDRLFDSLAKRRLADLLIFTGRRHDARPWLEFLMDMPGGTLDDLFHLADLDHLLSRPAAVFERAHEEHADPLFVEGAAFQALQDGKHAEAVKLFERVLQTKPTRASSYAGYGQALLIAEPQRLPDWRDQLPSLAAEDAGVLTVFEQLAEQEGKHDIACRLAARVVKQRPTSRIAWHRFGTTLARLRGANDAELVLQRAQQLQQLGTWMDDLFQHRQNSLAFLRVGQRLARLGRVAEAVAWARHVDKDQPMEARAALLRTQLTNNPRQFADEPTNQALTRLVEELASQPVSDFIDARVTKTSPADAGPSNPALGKIRFVETPTTSGLDFVYHSARDSTTQGARIIETTGGGVGVLDYDVDGWPDVYFTQGSRTFPVPSPNPDQDKLFRNRDGATWTDVSALAGIDDAQFGQGLAVGDFDNDGFPDLYVANYGINSLCRNQGDGTFQEVTPPALRERAVWTSSCVIVDLNRDGLSDLFDATYCQGTEVETRLCTKQGIARSCSPRVFGAEPDRVWINRGDGTWESADHAALHQPTGLGLGVVAFRASPASPLGLFVANDEEPNFWLIDAASNPGDKPQWEDRALTGGVAVDADGQTQACMGVACDDANGDGLPDLFVTNFYHESNTLYLATSESLFEDQTRTARLRDASWNMLGFGTQFIDADLDGWPDLLVANGHIDDLSALGEPFEMPPQCFQNLGSHFREVPASEAGECFAKRALGRGMARLDWNRDGREDAVIVNQDSPASLLTNASESTGHGLVLQFRATAGARDAIGTIVRIHCGSRVLTRQLTAGDGYQASNERQLVIGLGTAETADTVEVFWSGGTQQEIKSLPADHQYLIIQGQQSATAWRMKKFGAAE